MVERAFGLSAWIAIATSAARRSSVCAQLVADHLSTASSVNHTVKLPR